VRTRLTTALMIVLQCLSLQALTACHHNTEVPESTAATSRLPKQEPQVTSDTVTLNAEAAATAKIQMLDVQGKNQSAEIKTTGEIKADEGRVFHINSIVSGRVTKDAVTLGQMIKEGQILAVVQNLEVSKVYGQFIHDSHQNDVAIRQAQERLDLYKKNLDRAKVLFDEGIGAQKDVTQAQNQVNLTEIELSGLTEHTVHLKAEAEALLSAYGVKLKESTDAHYIETGSPLRAPRSGVVVAKNITMGDVVTADQPLYVVADLSKVWLDVSVFDKDLESITIGQKVYFRSDSLPKQVFEGTVNYIPPSATNMRTFTARAVLENPKLILKPGMFGQVSIEKSSSKTMAYLPDSAIQKFGTETFAFVDLGNNRYQKRLLDLDERLGDGYLLKSGVKVGERVAGEGSFKLKSELLKSQVGQDE
jgi:cobalt-zinc-cadmium efflux system membrane fusion protein